MSLDQRFEEARRAHLAQHNELPSGYRVSRETMRDVEAELSSRLWPPMGHWPTLDEIQNPTLQVYRGAPVTIDEDLRDDEILTSRAKRAIP